ncbi:hypothetical protein BN2476_80092 [Paraburkholderia piptadeniae]|uniref:Uncharacterized protein n=1 Tax=Paraburkholderia piptadeniae TaxID=1701573 RepID=A0A1N7RM31_9BURK|nr:hypothetical protein BN2476_80092 [Paraburkholderia piptadeniae]
MHIQIHNVAYLLRIDDSPSPGGVCGAFIVAGRRAPLFSLNINGRLPLKSARGVFRLGSGGVDRCGQMPFVRRFRTSNDAVRERRQLGARVHAVASNMTDTVPAVPVERGHAWAKNRVGGSAHGGSRTTKRPTTNDSKRCRRGTT